MSINKIISSCAPGIEYIALKAAYNLQHDNDYNIQIGGYLGQGFPNDDFIRYSAQNEKLFFLWGTIETARRANIIASDGSLIFYYCNIDNETKVIMSQVSKMDKKYLCLDITTPSLVFDISVFIQENNIECLNIISNIGIQWADSAVEKMKKINDMYNIFEQTIKWTGTLKNEQTINFNF